MTEFAINAAAALLGTLTASAIAFLFAIRRFKYERGFDRRLAWHEETARQLIDASEKVRQLAACFRAPNLANDFEKSCDEVMAAVPNVARLLLESQMYASRKGCCALQLASDDWGKLALVNFQIYNTADAEGQSDAAHRISPVILEAVAKSLRHAAHRLTLDVRKTLGLGSLNKGGSLYEDARGRVLGDLRIASALDRTKAIRSAKDVP